MLLCCVLAFHCTLPVARAADPVTASLTITAGAIALGGLSAAAVESTIGPQVAAIIGTTMQGLGTSTYTSEESAITKTQYIMSKIAVWCVQAKIAKEDFYKRVAQGVTVAANGTIQLTHDASKLISQFISWVFTQGEETVVPELPAAETYVQFGDFKFAPISVGSYSISGNWVSSSGRNYSIDSIQFYSVPSNASILFLSSGAEFVVLVPGQSSFPNNGWGQAYSGSNSIFAFNFGSSRHDYVRDKDGNYFTIALANIGRFTVTSSPSGFYSTSYSQFVSEIEGKAHSIVDSSATDAVFVGNKADWEENQDLLNPAIDGVTTITPDLINKLIDQLTEGQQATMDIADYLDSLVDAFDALKGQVAELTDVVTGLKKEVANPETIDIDVTVEPINPDPIPVVEPVELTPGGTIEGFSFPLDEIFPFCIPFDVVAALELFDVPAEAPSLHVHWELPYNIVFDFDLDLSAYDDIAALLRVMETLLFAVGLAVATRSLYIRS